MNPFATTQTQALIEGLRLLECFVTAPLGLYSDIRMLRESMSFPEARELSREETQRRRIAYSEVIEQPLEMALAAIETIGSSLDALSMIKADAGAPGLDSAWITRARRVLDRAKQRVGTDIRAGTASRVRGLYVIVDPEATDGRPVPEVAEAALKGGASVIQLRDKKRDKGAALPVTREVKALCEAHGALFVINDDADIAVACDADGLHVGVTDLPVSEARQVLAPEQLVGRSNNTVQEVMDSQAHSVDYLAIGAVFPTPTLGKATRTPVGVDMVRKAKDLVSQPVVATGGIDSRNVGEVISAGADCVCVVSAVTLAKDPESAARQLVDELERAKSVS